MSDNGGLVINDDTITSFNITNQMHHLRFIGFLTTFIDNCKIDITHLFCNSARTNHTTNVW